MILMTIWFDMLPLQLFLHLQLSYQIVDSMIWLGIRDMINEFRKKKLKLRPVTYLSGAQGSGNDIPHGYIWSPHLVPKPKGLPYLLAWAEICTINWSFFSHISCQSMWVWTLNLDLFLVAANLLVGVKILKIYSEKNVVCQKKTLCMKWILIWMVKWCYYQTHMSLTKSVIQSTQSDVGQPLLQLTNVFFFGQSYHHHRE